ncbi:MAG: ABC transporter permease [Acidobacteria bacterium]|nr:ABC transporter permease [Acidobacteriota bacterium]
MFFQDLLYAARGLRQNPVFTIVAALSLAIGIGANAAIFTLLDQLLLRPLPLPEPQRLVQLELPGPRQGETWSNRPFSNPMFREIRDGAKDFQGLAAQFSGSASLSAGDRSQMVPTLLVSGNWFETLGVKTVIGRPITPDDDKTVDGHPVVVLSHAFWQRRFGGDTSLVNKKILLNGQSMTVLGVTQPGFQGTDLLDPPDLYLPLAMQRMLMPNSARLEDRKLFFLQLFGRLKPDVTADQVKSRIDRLIVPILAEESKAIQFSTEKTTQRFLGRRFVLHPASRGNLSNRDDVEIAMWLLSGLVAGVLLIACANVANLLLARSTTRRKEIAVRLALGANRWQLVRLVLAESILLAGIGGVLGLLSANWATDALLAFANFGDSRSLPLETTPDARVMLFTLTTSILTGILFGLAPAFAATRPDVAPTLKDEGGAVTAAGAPAWLRKALVVVQVALSLLLLAAASLFLTSLHNLRINNPGFDADRLSTFSINPSMNGYDRDRAIALLDNLLAELRSLPAVNEVSMAAEPVLADSQNSSTFVVESYQPAPDENMNPLVNAVGPGFIHTMRIPLLQGRDFTDADNATAPKVAIISETFARMYFKDRDPIGRKVGRRIDRVPNMTVVGVIREIAHLDMRDERNKRQVYMPSSQDRSIQNRTFYIRSQAPLETLAPAIRAIVKKRDPSLAISNMRTMRDQIDVSLTMERVVSALCASFGLIATILAGIGLYGIMAFHVARRTKEIGIRMALGAPRGAVHRLVLGEAAVLALTGVAIGVPLAVVLSKYAKSLLFRIEPNDPWTYAGTALFLLTIALGASLIPALRASRIDPIRSLRH